MGRNRCVRAVRSFKPGFRDFGDVERGLSGRETTRGVQRVQGIFQRRGHSIPDCDDCAQGTVSPEAERTGQLRRESISNEVN